MMSRSRRTKSAPQRIEIDRPTGDWRLVQPVEPPEGTEIEWLTDGGPIRLGWPDPVNGPYVVDLHWAKVNGEARLVGLDLRSVYRADDVAYAGRPQPIAEGADILKPIRSGTLREFTFAETVELSRKLIYAMALADTMATDVSVKVDGEAVDTKTGAAVGESRVEAIERTGRGGRLPDTHYREVARVYVDAHNSGRVDVLNAVREQFQGTGAFPVVTTAMAHHWRRVARQRGYIPAEIKSRRGRPPKADQSEQPTDSPRTQRGNRPAKKASR